MGATNDGPVKWLVVVPVSGDDATGPAPYLAVVESRSPLHAMQLARAGCPFPSRGAMWTMASAVPVKRVKLALEMGGCLAPSTGP
jgi:hypothetical protein